MSTDNYFGPHLANVFDFTILFEQSILSLAPTCLFICIAPLRVFRIARDETCVKSGPLLWPKLGIAAIYFCFQVALVALWSLPNTTRTKTSIAEAVVSVFEALAILSLSYFEHLKSVKPSGLLNTYLLLTAILDVAPLRSYWIRHDIDAIAGVFTATLALKVVLLALEEMPKTLIVREKEVPRETRAGVISRSVFWWLNTLFLKGARSLIAIDNVGAIEEKFDSSRLLNQLEVAWEKNSKQGKLALMNCTIWTFRWQFAAGMFPRLLNVGFTFSQPFLINAIIDFVSEKEADIPIEHQDKSASGLIGATVLVYTGIAITTAWYKHMSYQLMTMWRGSLASIVFKKTLRLQATAVKDSAPVTLMSTDVEGISRSGEQIHDIWASFIELPVAIYLLYRHVGPPSLFILIPGFITAVSGAIITPGMEPAMRKWNTAVQERVGSVSTMLSHIKSIKMLGLGNFFERKLQSLRAKELRLSQHFRLILVQLNATAMFSAEFTPVIIILAAIFWTKKDEGLSVAAAFTSLSLIQIASQPLTHILISMVKFFGAFGCFTRLQDFLLLEEQVDSRELAPASLKSSSSFSAAAHQLGDLARLSDEVELTTISEPVYIEKAFDVSGDAIVVEEATFSAEKEMDVVHDLNLTIRKGTVNMIVGRVGCGKSSVLKAIVGELILKQGRIAVNVPRMAYCDQSPWLQNVPIRENIIGQSHLNEEWLAAVIKACALDEDVSRFPLGDKTIVGTGGVALSGGQKQRVALARAVYARRGLLVLDDVFSGLDSKTSRAVFQRLLGPTGILRLSRTTVVLATNHVNFLPAADCITMLEEGRVTRNQVTYDSLEPSVWGVLETNSKKAGSQDGSDTEVDDAEKQPEKPDVVAESIPKTTEADLARQTGDTDCYRIYLRSMGLFVIITFSLLCIAHTGLNKMPQIWLRLWTEKGTGPNDYGYLGGYIAFAAASLLTATTAIGFFCLVGIPRSATRLHEMLLKAVMRAPFFFFTSTDSGVTTNRFSQDMTLIDQELPMSFFATFLLALHAIADTGVIASGASYVGAAIPASVLALYFVQKYYLRTSRQMRFLDLEMKSPLYTQFSETLAGLSTIRAFGWSSDFILANHVHLDNSQRPFYTMFCIQRWLQVVLDLFVAGLALLLVALALNVSGTTSKGAIGLAMVNLINFNSTLTMMIDQWTQLETSLGAISRLKWFMNNTPNENKDAEKDIPPSDWPAQGTIELENVSASYSDETEPVIRDVSLKILPGQKVGVCGRSGSGKSSLVLTMLRLLEIRSGSIKIDSQDLSTLPRQEIRSRLTALPQDPLKLSGTVRHNLDPEERIQADAPLTEALRKTSIWSTIESRGGLDAAMNDLGFSAGQLQLFCLARALLSRSSVVLLDEATSSVDGRTDEELRRVVRDELAGRTVVEVAHRLEVVRECDVAVVMSEGRVLETGPPEELLRTEGSAFKELWDSQGL